MGSKNKHVIGKQSKLFIGIALLLLLGLSSSILYIARIGWNDVSALHHAPGIATPTPPGTRSATSTALSTPQLLFSDSFSDNSKGWYTGSVSGYTRRVSNSVLTLSDTNHKILTESLPTGDTFDDFAVTATLVLLQADEHDSVGFYVRGDSNLDHDYRVTIFGDNTYAVSKESLDATNHPVTMFLVSPTHTSLLKAKGRQNTLSVMMKGSNLVLLINGTVINAAIDADYTRGQIALFVENGDTSDGVTATFSHIEVYSAPERLPGT